MIGILTGPEPISRDTCIIKSCVFQSTVNVSALYVKESPLVFDGDKLSCLVIRLLHLCFGES